MRRKCAPEREKLLKRADHNLNDYDYCLGIRDQGLETVETGLQDPGQSLRLGEAGLKL
jgi:hypothetical protein